MYCAACFENEKDEQIMSRFVTERLKGVIRKVFESYELFGIDPETGSDSPYDENGHLTDNSIELLTEMEQFDRDKNGYTHLVPGTVSDDEISFWFRTKTDELLDILSDESKASIPSLGAEYLTCMLVVDYLCLVSEYGENHSDGLMYKIKLPHDVKSVMEKELLACIREDNVPKNRHEHLRMEYFDSFSDLQRWIGDSEGEGPELLLWDDNTWLLGDIPEEELEEEFDDGSSLADTIALLERMPDTGL